MVASRRDARGFTLIELVVTVMLLFVVAAVGMPTFFNVLDQRRLRGAVDRVAADLRVVQSQAVQLGYKHQLKYSSGSYTLQRYNTTTSAWVSMGSAYSLSTDYKAASLASIKDNGGAGSSITEIVFRPQGDVDSVNSTITFPIVLTVTGNAGSRTIQVTRTGLIRISSS